MLGYRGSRGAWVPWAGAGKRSKRLRNRRRGPRRSVRRALHRGGGRHGGQGEPEHGPAALAALDPDAPAVALDDLAADREADARALERLAVVQALEHLENAFPVPGVEADPVVCD